MATQTRSWVLGASLGLAGLVGLGAGCGDDGGTSGSSTGTASASGGSGGGTASSGSSGGETAGESSGAGGTSAGGTSGTTSGGGTTADPTTTSGSTGEPTTSGGAEEGMRVGVDVRDVSPDAEALAKKNIYMGAYGAPYTRGAAQGVHDAIYARSFAIEAGGAGIVLAIVDLPGMGNRVTRAIRQKVAGLTGLSEAQVLVGTTHTHSSPDLMGLWGGVPGEYRTWLIDQTAASMAAAWAGRVQAELRVGAGVAPANNRRGWGYTDDAMTVLDAFDLEGARLGTLVNFAAHPVILGEDNKLISCDYTGYFVQALEAELGAPVGLFNGTLGDATPKVPQGDYADDFDRAQAYGALLAGIAAEIAGATEVVEPTVVYDERKWVEDVNNFLFSAAAQLGILQYDFQTVGLQQKVTTQSTYFRLGTKVQGASFPGESLTRNGLAIKEQMKAPYRMILGNTGDALGYFIPSDEWQTGKNNNYEETVSVGKSAGDNALKFISELIVADNANF